MASRTCFGPRSSFSRANGVTSPNRGSGTRCSPPISPVFPAKSCFQFAGYRGSHCLAVDPELSANISSAPHEGESMFGGVLTRLRRL